MEVSIITVVVEAALQVIVCMIGVPVGAPIVLSQYENTSTHDSKVRKRRGLIEVINNCLGQEAYDLSKGEVT